MVASNAIPKSVTRAEIARETDKDEVLREVKNMIENRQYKPIKYYEKFKNELSTTSDGLILKGNQIVAPNSLIPRLVKIAHSGHLGIIKTTSLLRSCVWFPDLHRVVERQLKACHKCQVNTNNKTTKHPIIASKMPVNPWQNIAIYFYSSQNLSKYLMVLICEHSRYPIVRRLSSINAKNVIKHLNDIFSHFGIPQRIKTDNGPPFNSYEFKKFTKENGIEHHKITPHHPQENGLVERFMASMGKVLRNSNSNNFESELQEFLRNYRATPHKTTKVAPFDLLLKSKATSTSLQIEKSEIS